MTLFWGIAAGMAAVALLFLLPPLLRSRVAAPDSRIAVNAAIYREQLEELAAELQRGALTREEFERSSREVEHRIVAEHAAGGPAPAMHRPAYVAALAVGLLLPIAAGVGYWQLGSPEAISGVANEAGHMVSRDQVESLVERLSARMEQNPGDAEGWKLLARTQAVLGRFEQSTRAYERALKITPGDAAMLADYADALAMARGRKLAGEPYDAVKRALAIDPDNIKALAIAGSAEFELRNFTAAIAFWERVRKLVPPESEFARSVGESIAEAQSLGGMAVAKAAGAKAATAPAKGAAAGGGNSVQGEVSIDPALAAKLSPTDTLFVLARPVSGSRMPLAVARTTVAALPYRFNLDDSMAMAPGATISSHSQVVIVARVSKAGTAAPGKGDIEGVSAAVAPGAAGVKVVLSRVVE